MEVLKGEAPKDLVLPGILADTDDFNDMPPPYRFVRPAGRWGNCWAYQYRNGAEYLLLLKRRGEGYTVDWYALGATNEQVRGELDPWVYWVKGFLAAQRADPPSRSANLKREGVQ